MESPQKRFFKHFQLNYTFQSQVLRKYIPSWFIIIYFFKCWLQQRLKHLTIWTWPKFFIRKFLLKIKKLKKWPIRYLLEPGKVKVCSTKTVLIEQLIDFSSSSIVFEAPFSLRGLVLKLKLKKHLKSYGILKLHD